MAHDSDLPCDGDGICMVCKGKPGDGETLTCKTCVAPWHVACLSAPPETLAAAAQWECPDCAFVAGGANAAATAAVGVGSEIVAAIRAIESDGSLTEQEKAKRRQELMSGGGRRGDDEKEKVEKANGVLDLFDEGLNCSFCMQLPERPVTTPCGHNFCLKCFEKWIGQGKRTCANCRNAIPPKMASNPRINSALVIAIRMAKMSKTNGSGGPPKEYHFVHNQNRPDKAYTTERAKKAGKANACSGKIFVTVPNDHFGPILAENDPERKQGVLVGETWEGRMECRQWGAHFPHVAGIAGQSEYGAQSVALSGGYEDDEDHGEWFLYTGSGGRDLSGNKRTNKMHSFDQKFDKSNEALRVSCRKGYPVRVVRSHKEKDSSYAPETGVRYDGIYRIEKCWRKAGIQGFMVCRYLFVRCDNAPAPWTSDDNGDRPRPLPNIPELKNATDITERKGVASWDYDEEKGCWMWKKPPPESRKPIDSVQEDGTTKVRRHRPALSIQERLLKEFSCSICRKVMSLPLTTPCAHNFCKSCLESSFAGQTFIKQRTCEGGRTLRTQKNIMKCPSCPNDISDFLQNPQVNRELMGVIESLQRQSKQTEDDEASEETDGTDEKPDVVPDVVSEDAELCSETSDMLKEDTEGKEGIQKSPTKIKPQEQKKSSGGDSIPTEKPLEKLDSVDDEHEKSGKETKKAAVDNKVKRSNKRKADDSPGARVKTRKQKA
ncbi:E3 ubiquitin-protein ligase ORTHRUS 2-like isoform X1 [Rhododendron vialii]|uniref:E3 ubiquitin-protein ligase ORTHRUS 2-like isoform X1 n=1 Tax=Rhododendron vialii TaxID=182163 RepID=UPI00265F9F79|nr:E3 ubiquitin-protein ligase ORTHRUS 2-like isoform X1 [Rhododendron vialii]